MVALYRPGPMEWIPSFIKRKHGQEKVQYIHNDLKPILEPTYGIGVYQEQILEIAKVFAGFSLGEADLLRRAIGKKIEKEMRAQKKKFIAGAEKNGYDNTLAQKIFDDVVTPFAGYGFNKAHATGYARIAYETAYLKAHYPAEFMAALLSSDAQRTDRILIEIEECRAMGIQVLPPDINESLRHFTVISGEGQQPGIRFGLAAIKGVGDSTVQQIIAIREEEGKFTSLENFATRIPSRLLNKKLLESLAKAGALDSLGERHVLVEHYDSIVDFAKACGDISSTQTNLFESMTEAAEAAFIEFPKTLPVSPQRKLQWEKEVLGLYVSSHPLAGMKKYIGKKAQLIGNLTMKDVGKKISLAGIVESVKKITTKKGETMAIVMLEDPTAKIEVTLFPRIYAEAAGYLEEPDTVLVVGGTLDYRAGQLQMRAHATKKASLSTMITHAKKEGFYDEEEAKHGLTLSRPVLEEEGEIEVLDEEGNVIAGETVVVSADDDTEDYLGPLGKWIAEGMETRDILEVLTLKNPKTPSISTKENVETDASPTKISVHTIGLPERAPKKMLLDLKRVFQTFPGKEKIQLKIGEQIIPLPLTVSFSTILRKKIDEVIERYTATAPKP
jgi:DNA polymerase-3 subunit alpha